MWACCACAITRTYARRKPCAFVYYKMLLFGIQKADIDRHIVNDRMILKKKKNTLKTNVHLSAF